MSEIKVLLICVRDLFVYQLIGVTVVASKDLMNAAELTVLLTVYNISL